MRGNRQKFGRGFTLLELIIVVGIISFVFALILAGVQRARSAADRTKCLNSLKQLALALHQHASSQGQLPPGHRSPIVTEKLPYTGWPLSILPYLEQENLYSLALQDFQKQRNPFLGHAGFNIPLSIFLCPTDARASTPQRSKRNNLVAAYTSYQGVSGLNCQSRDGMLIPDGKIRLADAQDGLSNTLLLGERPVSHDFEYSWWYAGNGQDGHGSLEQIMGVRELNLLVIEQGSSCGPGQYPFMAASGVSDPCGQFHFWSLHSGGGHFAFVDGSVRFMAYSANSILPALASRSGGETQIVE